MLRLLMFTSGTAQLMTRIAIRFKIHQRRLIATQHAQCILRTINENPGMPKQETKEPRARLTPNRKLLMVIAALILAVLVFLALTPYGNYFWGGNRAEEVAKPIEIKLAEAGAIKVCATGNGGWGVDNKRPWHDATYKVAVGVEKARELALSAARDSGYSLAQAKPGNNGDLGVADVYLDAWWFDTTSKQTSFSELERGPVRLYVGVNASGSDTSCGGSKLAIDSTNSTIVVRVSLPDAKR